MFGIEWSWNLVLLAVPSVALAAFMALGLDPLRLRPWQVRALAVMGGVGPLLFLLPFASACLEGTCIGAVPIFTLKVGADVVALALTLDPFSAVVGTTVAVIGAAVILFSIAYMADHSQADLRRFFSLMTLFLAAMLTMVLAGDSIVLFLGWEMMGLCSYFLIAYDTTSATAVRAGRKAFLITRLADAMLLAALLLLFLEARSVRLDALIPAGMQAEDHMRLVIACLLLGGALGKSAQVPFHTWLPSAMAGPTPVSALLHSATMVAAGAVLLIRFAPLMQTEPVVQAVAAGLGAVTAVFGAASALFQQDIKRLLAYSSISQIGFMMLAIGVGAPQAAAAHFVVHALFKSLLFMAAGDIVHHCPRGTDILAFHGALRRKPLSFAAFTAGAASLAGLPVLTAGWWSKEAMLASIWGAGPVLWGAAVAAAVLTAAYATRAVLTGLMPGRDLPFQQKDEGSGYIVFPLVFLAGGALAAGLLVGPIIRFLGAEVPHAPAFTLYGAAAAPALGVAIGLALAYVPDLAEGMYRIRRRVLRRMPHPGRPPRPDTAWERFALWLNRGLKIESLYRVALVWPFVRFVRWLNGRYGGIPDPVGTLAVQAAVGLHRIVAAPLAPDWLDRLWRLAGRGVLSLWTAARVTQTGRLRDYALAMAAGAAGLLIAAWSLAWN